MAKAKVEEAPETATEPEVAPDVSEPTTEPATEPEAPAEAEPAPDAAPDEMTPAEPEGDGSMGDSAGMATVGECVVDDGTAHHGRAVNGLVCSAHANRYAPDGSPR